MQDFLGPSNTLRSPSNTLRMKIPGSTASVLSHVVGAKETVVLGAALDGSRPTSMYEVPTHGPRGSLQCSGCWLVVLVTCHAWSNIHSTQLPVHTSHTALAGCGHFSMGARLPLVALKAATCHLINIKTATVPDPVTSYVWSYMLHHASVQLC